VKRPVAVVAAVVGAITVALVRVMGDHLRPGRICVCGRYDCETAFPTNIGARGMRIDGGAEVVHNKGSLTLATLVSNSSSSAIW
jgi:hypothetical protein